MRTRLRTRERTVLVVGLVLALLTGSLGVPAPADAAWPAPNGGIYSISDLSPHITTPYLLTADNKPVQGVMWYIMSSQVILGGPLGSRVRSYAPGGAGDGGGANTTRLVGNPRHCGEESWPVPMAVRWDGSTWQSYGACYDGQANANISHSGRRALLAPLVAHVFDPSGDSLGRGDAVVFTGWEHRNGRVGEDYCGTGDLGIRGTLDQDGRSTSGLVYDRGAYFGYDYIFPLLSLHHLDWDARWDVEPGGHDLEVTARYAPPVPDVSPPMVTVHSPAACAQVVQGQELQVVYACEDIRVSSDDPDTLASCEAPVPNGGLLDTSVPGRHTFTVKAKDIAGNEREQSVPYTVHAVSLPDERVLSSDGAMVRSLTSSSGESNRLAVGEAGILTVQLQAPLLGPQQLNPSYPSLRLQGLEMTEYLHEHWRENTPIMRVARCWRATPFDDEGVSTHDAFCHNMRGGHNEVYLPVVGTEAGTFSLGRADGNDGTVGPLTIEVYEHTDEHTLEVEIEGQGSVTSDPSGIDCPDDCEESYQEGTEVSLTATADPGSVFAGWAGACSGTDPCALSMDQDKQVTATFELAPSPAPTPPPPSPNVCITIRIFGLTLLRIC